MERKIAIIELGGKQHLVREGVKVVVNKLTEEVDKILKLVNILNQEPVEVKVLTHQLGPKINGLKFKAKTRYYKRYGHRQQQTVVEVLTIGGKTSVETKKVVNSKPKAVSKKAPAKSKAAPKKAKKSDG